MNQNPEPSRIPRPKGTTILSQNGLTEALEDRLIDAYFMGLFPYRGEALDLYSFSSLYGINLKRLKRKVSENLSDSLFDKEQDLRKTLEDQRLKLLGGVLSRMGRSDFEILRILRYLSSRVLANPAADPLLVKELNSAVTNQIRLTESELKSITLLNQTLDTLPIATGDASHTLTREEIIERLSEIQRDPNLLLAHVEGTPLLEPGASERVRLKGENYNRQATHDYQKLEDQLRIPDLEDIPVLPM